MGFGYKFDTFTVMCQVATVRWLNRHVSVYKAHGKLKIHMLESRPSPVLGSSVGYTIVAGLFLLDMGLAWLLVSSPITLLSFFWGVALFLSVPILAAVAYFTSALSSAYYRVVDGAFVIEWGRVRRVVPLGEIHTLVMGQTMGPIKRFWGMRWPGSWVGYGQVRGEADSAVYDTLFYAAAPLPQQLLVVTNSIAYAISPTDLENFRDCLVALRGANLAAKQAMPTPNLGVETAVFWQDRPAHLLWGTAVCLNALLFAGLCAIYGRLPATVPLHFNEAGLVDRLDSPAHLFILPAIGLLAWLLNGAIGWVFYQWHQERPFALVSWGTAVIIQCATWAVCLNLLNL